MLRKSALAPSLLHASTASIQPRWLRHMIATPSPALMPSRAHACASALVRSSTSRNVSVPSSSMIAGSCGKFLAAAV